VITRSVIFSLKCTRNRLAAGLCPDPLGELEHSSRPPSHIRGWDGDPRRGGRERDRKERRGMREGKEGEESKGGKKEGMSGGRKGNRSGP